MKKKALTIIAAGTLWMLAGCGKKEEPQIPSVLDDNVLVVGILDTQDRSCYRAVDDGGNPYYAGWEPDILTLLDAEMDSDTQAVNLEYKYAKDRAELISWLNTGEVELAAGAFTRLDTYSTQYLMSDDYGFGSIYLVNPKNGYLDTLAAFEDEAIGVSNQIPVSSISEMKGVDRIVQNTYGDVAVLAQDITNGVVSAGICTEDETMMILQHTDLQAAEMRDTPQMGLVFLSQVGQEYLMSWVNYAIDQYYYNISTGATAEETTEGGE